ncbi:unnamed protein product [Rotaria sp. Silwood1]|nr:unnamed protein product [Rotaria sp. Silwood1]CAF1389520.1 unnamed protein product [Rotaria sp. Silwood1]CAF1392390.1 unnamed protein product [Rotaria sp. Silwood1]CAF3493190.1 unnamed protein product [Rotaria sp. Silwood1]CAF3653087.1 unnamed protein product [Rotaria sp. Silwood1]
MSDGDGDQENSKTLEITLIPTKLALDIAKEKTQQQQNQLLIIEKEKELLVEQNSKRMKLPHGPPSSSSFSEEQSRAINEHGFFNRYAKYIKSFEINSLLHDNNHFNDNDDLDDQ